MQAPRRMFLGELPLFIHKSLNKNGSCEMDLRLMGRVVHISHQSADKASNSSTDQLTDRKQSEDVPVIVIDDGTSLLDVVAIKMHFQLEIGQLVDCIGNIQFAPESPHSSTSIKSDKKQLRQYYLCAKMVSRVKNPQEETLRQLELAKMSTDTKFDVTIAPFTLKKMPQNGIVTSPYLEQKLNIFHHKTHPFPSLTLNSDDTFRCIKYSADFGGLSYRELDTLFGATASREKRAIRQTVEKLRTCGMVYVNKDKLLPL